MLEYFASVLLGMFLARSNRNFESRCAECRTMDTFERRRSRDDRVQTNDRQKQGDDGS